MSSSNDLSQRGFDASEENGLQVAALMGDNSSDFFITATPVADETPRALFQSMADAVSELDARIVSLEVFGVAGKEMPAFHETFGDVDWPVTWLEEGCDQPAPLYGIQAWAVTDADVEPLVVDGRVVGSVFDMEDVQYCRLGGLVPENLSQSRPEQAQGVFSLMQRSLAEAGMDFSHVVRTWFYNHEMLQWYGEFNKVRTAFFKEHGVFDGLVPASTGIGGRNAAGAALTAGLLAMKAPGGATKAVEVPSPLQCPAPSYGSSFSRAVEIDTPRGRRLLVSGTASIDPDGHSAHIGDTDAQIELTMAVVRAILESRDMDWYDVTRAIAYFKNSAERPAFDRYCAANAIEGMPVLFTNNDICRDDLLFEIEVDAAI